MELSGYAISIFGLACYFLPGLTFTLLFKGKQNLAELVVYTAILSIGFSTILGMVFGGLGILDKAVYAYRLLGLPVFAGEGEKVFYHLGGTLGFPVYDF